MNDPVNINQVTKLNLGLQETDEVFITRGGSGPYRVPASSFPWQQKGDKGDAGGSWAPVLALVTDGVRLVHRVVDWVGGTGEKPTMLGYVGALGLVDTAAAAVDVRGAQGIQGIQGDQGTQGDQGVAGWSPVLAVVADGERRVQQVVDWTGGAGVKPQQLGYIGAVGLVGTPAEAVNVRGAVGVVSGETVRDALVAAPAAVRNEIGSLVSGGTVASGLVATVRAFQAGSFSFPGGEITLPASGTWYIGVEMSSGQLRTLPRLGHRGWVPVASAVTSAVEITELQQITPVLPTCRIPRTMAKVLAGKPISVVVMGSSLTASEGVSTDWPGMVFGAGTADKYKVPTTVSCQYTGVGGSPNQYQLAQLGYASFHNSYGYPDSGVSGAIDVKGVPNGRSNLLSGVDVVVLGCLANGGDYRLETIEPLVRKLRQSGVEVIMTTDNPQGPSTVYATMTAAGLYVDGPEVIRVAELYGVEIADTAAYVVDAHIRASGVGIYGDSIHMTSGTPTGPNVVVPANGHEAWARAVRSVFSATPGRPGESRPLPPIRVVTDYKTPADAFVILPKDERQLRLNQPTQGVLAAHPWGASSFARRWSPTVESTQDLLILATGKVAMLSADAAVGLALIHYRDVADGACTLDIKINGGVAKTVTISTVPFANEWFTSLYTPTEFNAPGPCSQGSVEILVTSGTLKVAAFVALTADVDFLLPEQVSYVGAGWLPKESSRSGLPGRPTDTAGDFAVVRCTGRRLAWVISGNPGSKQVQTWGDREIAAASNYGGNYHVFQVGKHFGPGANHVIKCVEANAIGSQASGHALHVGGAIVINDR